MERFNQLAADHKARCARLDNLNGQIKATRNIKRQNELVERRDHLAALGKVGVAPDLASVTPLTEAGRADEAVFARGLEYYTDGEGQTHIRSRKDIPPV